MPKASWREKFKDKKRNVKSKDAFKNWYKGKLKQRKEVTEKVTKRNDRSKGCGKGGKPAGKGKGKSKGNGASQAQGTFGDEASGEGPLSVELGESQGASQKLVRRLMDTKQRLLAGNAAAARAGVARAEPGAWAAANAAAASSRDGGKGQGHVKGGKGDKGGKSAGKGSKGSEQKGTGAVPIVREELVALNRRLGEYASARDLSGARKVLADLESRRWANGHTYAAAINALCRCGDWKGAEAALERAESAGLYRRGTGAASGVIARTSMLRGYCEVARDIGKARQLFTKMEKEKRVDCRPNTRSANTFLRGCLQLGAVDDADKLLLRMENQWSQDETWSKDHGGSPDASSYEVTVSLLCQALRYKYANKVAMRSIDVFGPSPGCAAMFVSIARAAALKKDTEFSTGAAKQARKLLQGEESHRSKVGGGSAIVGSGGKRGMSKSGEEHRGGRQKSLQVFQDHRKAELLSELDQIDTFIQKNRPVQLQTLWCRTVLFDELGTTDTKENLSTSKGGAEMLCRHLSDQLGLKRGSPDAENVLKVFEGALQEETALLQPKKKRKKTGSGNSGSAHPKQVARLDLSALFNPAADTPSPTIRPVYLEICSGGGEWLCAQAQRNSGVCWVACELRFDRGARCFQHLALAGLANPRSNAGVIIGDASEALQRRLRPSCCTRLFINHPEPPHQRDLTHALPDKQEEPGKDSDRQPHDEPQAHLLTPTFLQDGCGSVLNQGGILTICTDNFEYGRWLAEVLAKAPLTEVYEDALHGTTADREGRLDRIGSVGVRSVPPPVSVCGAQYHGKAGASYFQRLKRSEKGSHGMEDERYFLCMRRR